jgi:hypothetical protein
MPNVRKPSASRERPFTRSIYDVKGEVREFMSGYANHEDAPAYDTCSIQTEIFVGGICGNGPPLPRVKSFRQRTVRISIASQPCPSLTPAAPRRSLTLCRGSCAFAPALETLWNYLQESFV